MERLQPSERAGHRSFSGSVRYRAICGQVIEVFLAASDIEPSALAWAPMLIINVTLSPDDGSLTLECKSLGGVDAEIDAAPSAAFNRRMGPIHLCTSQPCEDVLGEFYHATKIRWWKGGIATYKGGSPSGRRQVDKWLSRDERPFGERGAQGRDPMKTATAKSSASKKEADPKAGTTPVPRGARRERK